jgi:hypothetical protein
MAESIQCETCGAVLLKEDIYCGECGTPRPIVAPASGPAAPEPQAAAPPPRRTEQTQASPGSAWRVAAIALGTIGAILCLLGMAAFLLFGLTEGGDVSPTENWIYSTFCCLLPIAGTGAILALFGAGIWWFRLRSR